VAYQRGSSYASSEVLNAIKEYIDLRQNLPPKIGDDEAYKAEVRKRNEELKVKIDNIFIAI
jgi:hypothetical protein